MLRGSTGSRSGWSRAHRDEGRDLLDHLVTSGADLIRYRRRAFALPVLDLVAEERPQVAERAAA